MPIDPRDRQTGRTFRLTVIGAVKDTLSAQRTFNYNIEGFVGLGLIVGVAALGVITARAGLSLGGIFLAVYAVALLATLAPAVRPSRVYPAEALRYQ